MHSITQWENTGSQAQAGFPMQPAASLPSLHPARGELWRKGSCGTVQTTEKARTQGARSRLGSEERIVEGLAVEGFSGSVR